MILNKLILENFKQFKKEEVIFPLGLTGIVGRNGAGKSTLFEALLLCLYGDLNPTDRKLEKTFIKRAGTPGKEPVRLMLYFSIGEKDYWIQREFRGTHLVADAALYDASDTQIAVGVHAVNQAITRMLNMNKDAFQKSVFSGQKELHLLSRLTREERKRLIRKMLGIERLDKVQERMRKDQREKQSRIQGISGELPTPEEWESLKGEIKHLEGTLAGIKIDEKKLKAVNKKIQAKLKAVKNDFLACESIQKKHFHLESRFQNLQGELKKGRQSLKQNQEDLKELWEKKKGLKLQEPKEKAYQLAKAEKTKLEPLRLKVEKRTHLLRSESEIKKDLDVLQTRKSRMEKSLKPFLLSKEKTAVLGRKIQSENRELIKLNNEKERIDQKLGGIKQSGKEKNGHLEKIQKLGPESKCPICLRPFTARPPYL